MIEHSTRVCKCISCTNDKIAYDYGKRQRLSIGKRSWTDKLGNTGNPREASGIQAVKITEEYSKENRSVSVSILTQDFGKTMEEWGVCAAGLPTFQKTLEWGMVGATKLLLQSTPACQFNLIWNCALYHLADDIHNFKDVCFMFWLPAMFFGGLLFWSLTYALFVKFSLRSRFG